jgi:1-acyl-sn-glycerol-3-phosphate acyltransferase
MPALCAEPIRPPAAFGAGTAPRPLEFSGACRRNPGGLLRCAARTAGFLAAFAAAAVDYAARVLCTPRAERRGARAGWVHRSSRRFARVFGLTWSFHGTPPESGMIVSNHLSYLDILIYGAITPCVFVSKREIAAWPLIGLFARAAGTIFIDRTRRSELPQANAAIAAALRAGLTVVLFPEGTSTDGSSVRPFKSSLLEPLAAVPAPATPAAIGYAVRDGSVANEVCYWGEMTFFPHLLNLFTKRAIAARVAFGEPTMAAVSRRESAAQLHENVATLHRALPQITAR